MILTPVYYPFHNVVTNNDKKLVKVDLDYDHGYFTMNYEAIEKAIVENDVKMFIQCSLHNPAGRVWTEQELQQLFHRLEKSWIMVRKFVFPAEWRKQDRSFRNCMIH